MNVRGHCDTSPDAEKLQCDYELVHKASPSRFVDLFQEQPANPEKGMVLPNGDMIGCASNDAEFILADITCPEGFSSYSGDKTEDVWYLLSDPTTTTPTYQLLRIDLISPLCLLCFLDTAFFLA